MKTSGAADAVAALTVLFLAVPQGLAYATIAGLPPVVGLYAAAIPTIVSSVFRSSSHVVGGPSNALSLLVGAAVASGLGADPVQIALTLALMVGVMQAVAGLLRLGAVVDFISSAVVLGYITGAGVLIAVGQLAHATGVPTTGGRIWVVISRWLETLGVLQPIALGVTLGTVGVVVLVRRVNARSGRRIPSAIVAMGIGLIVNVAFGLERRGLQVVSDLGEVPSRLPPLTIPDLELIPRLLPVAVACAVLSLVESSSVARSIASRTGQRLDASREFVGQGLSNVAAAFFGGYPTSGSLARSALNARMGAKTRMSGVLTGAFMLLALLGAGPVLARTPISSLAGLMFVVAYDLIDVGRIRRVVRASRADGVAFVVTLLGTWLLSLDLAIYLGVGISLVLFLRRARLIRVVEVVPDVHGQLQERPSGIAVGDQACGKIRMVHVEGSLFFGAAGELRDGLAAVAGRPGLVALVVRLKRASGLDATSAAVLREFAGLMQDRGQHLVLAGVTQAELEVLERCGVVDALGADNVFPSQPQWFSAVRSALRRAGELCGGSCEGCALAPSVTADEGDADPSPESERP